MLCKPMLTSSRYLTSTSRFTFQECTLTVEEARYKEGCVNWNQVIPSPHKEADNTDWARTSVLHKVHHWTHQPLPWSHFIRQHRPGLGGDIPGHLLGGLDGRDVFCSGRSLFLELDILRLSYSGEIFQSSVTLDLTQSKSLLGWVILHDQLMPCRHRHPVLGDKEKRDG